MIHPVGQQMTVGELRAALEGLDDMTPVTVDGAKIKRIDPTSAEVRIGVFDENLALDRGYRVREPSIVNPSAYGRWELLGVDRRRPRLEQRQGRRRGRRQP